MGVILFCSRHPYSILLQAILIYYNSHQWSGITLAVSGTIEIPLLHLFNNPFPGYTSILYQTPLWSSYSNRIIK